MGLGLQDRSVSMGTGSNNAITLNRLLFATDFSDTSGSAFEHAISIATRYCAELYVVHVIDSEPFDVIASEEKSSVLKQAEEQGRQKLACMLATQAFPAERCHIVVAPGVIPHVLTELMREDQIDLAVLGTHGRRGFQKVLMGSVAEEVFRVAPCPVLTVGPKTAPVNSGLTIRHILYPVQFAPDPSQAARYAISLAECYGAKLTIMNVVDDTAASANEPECFPAPAGSWIDEHIPKGSALRSRLCFERGFGRTAESILQFTSDAGVDLIVLALQRKDPVIAAHLPKPDTAYELVSRASCPVLSVR